MNIVRQIINAICPDNLVEDEVHGGRFPKVRRADIRTHPGQEYIADESIMLDLEYATGRARCAICCQLIAKGERAAHIGTNSRAAPFFHPACLVTLGQLAQTIEVREE